MALARSDVVERVDALVGSPVFMLLRDRIALGIGCASQVRTRSACNSLRTLGPVASSSRGTLPIGARASRTFPHPSPLRVARDRTIEGMRVDVGGLRIPFRARGGIGYGFAHTVNLMHDMRIGEASNPGPGGVWMEVGGGLLRPLCKRTPGRHLHQTHRHH